jgi:hypothetical protein
MQLTGYTISLFVDVRITHFGHPAIPFPHHLVPREAMQSIATPWIVAIMALRASGR